jgi:site-specific DNA recombinase
MQWVTEALRQSHVDERQFHEEAIGRLQAEYQRLHDRLDAMYIDKLDGRVETAFFDRKAAEWRSEQDRLSQTIEVHRSANRTYLAEGIQLLDWARRAHILFRKQAAGEKRQLLNFVLSNCTWKGGELQLRTANRLKCWRFPRRRTKR